MGLQHTNGDVPTITPFKRVFAIVRLNDYLTVSGHPIPQDWDAWVDNRGMININSPDEDHRIVGRLPAGVVYREIKFGPRAGKWVGPKILIEAVIQWVDAIESMWKKFDQFFEDNHPM